MRTLQIEPRSGAKELLDALVEIQLRNHVPSIGCQLDTPHRPHIDPALYHLRAPVHTRCFIEYDRRIDAAVAHQQPYGNADGCDRYAPDPARPPTLLCGGNSTARLGGRIDRVTHATPPLSQPTSGADRT